MSEIETTHTRHARVLWRRLNNSTDPVSILAEVLERIEQRGRDAERKRLHDACQDALVEAIREQNADGELLPAPEIIGRVFAPLRPD